MLKALVLDYITKGESVNEGRIISLALEQMGWDVELIKKPRKARFIDALFKAYDKNLIHISAHSTDRNLSYSAADRGVITVDEIRDYFVQRLKYDEMRLDNVVILFSGCDSASRNWVELFLKSLNAKYYIGAFGEPSIAEGILFPLHIYFDLWGAQKRMGIKRAFDNAVRCVRTEAKWRLFPE